MKEAHIFVEDTINTALSEGASDIFFLPQEKNFNVRIRINGIQKSIAEVPHEYGEMCVAHIKALASLLTYRTRISQDGVIRKFDNAELRISTLPTICGERVSIRIMQERSSVRFLEDLGFQTEAMVAIKKMTLRPNGLTILTGPTGCGKTTTIYAMIRELLRNSQDPASIITIEDPVECAVDGISQTSVSKGEDEWGYAKALRAALRQDVKTLIIGEMRDKEVVKVALDAALTGHRVITTYHAGDIPSVFARMLHQGFEPFLIAAALSGVVTQRLVKSESGSERIPVAATLTLDDTWRDFISDNPPLCEIRRKIASTPSADLTAEASRMESAGVITKNWKLEI
jgi:type II secretory ATPase GspE/PulE/Tfp pilus assembly ATPase PilB-like protein